MIAFIALIIMDLASPEIDIPVWAYLILVGCLLLGIIDTRN